MEKKKEWKLVWSDEFGYSGLPDATKWGFERGYVRNNESQYYTDRRPENCRVENGMLIIEARKERIKDPGYDPKAGAGSREYTDYTSASIHTFDTGNWTYGRVEVRAKIPTGRGTWPAIWMMGTNIFKLGWPDCGEIDIMENVGHDPDKMVFSVHTKAYNHPEETHKSAIVTRKKPFKDFHIYAIEWFEDRMDFFLDDDKVFTFNKEDGGNDVWPFDKPQYLKLNLAIGGGWGGQKGIDDSIFPLKFYIDHVRVYQLGE